MKILVTGATGRVGSEIVRQSLTRNHTIIALARHPENLQIDNSNLRKVAGDVQNAATMISLMKEIDAVIHVVGIGSSKQPTVIYSEGARSIIEGMERYGVKRLVAISSQAADNRASLTLLQKLVLQPILQHFFGATYDDMRRMDHVLRESKVEWTQVRAPYINDKPAKGKYRFSADEQLPRFRDITVGDIATAFLDIAERADLGGKDVFVAN